MTGKIALWLTVLMLMIRWPLYLVLNPPQFETKFVWQLDDAQEENRLRIQKLGLDTSGVKRIFYNKLTTIPVDRYTKNVLSLLNPNSYFFDNFPRPSLAEAGYSPKFPYPAIIGFALGAYISIKKKKYLKLWLFGLTAVLLVSLFKQIEGWNLALYPVLAVFTFEGLKETNKYRYGWLLLMLMATVGVTEIGRMLPW